MLLLDCNLSQYGNIIQCLPGTKDDCRKGIFGDDYLGSVTGKLEDLSIPAQVGNFQVERHSALLCALNIAGSA